MRGERTSLRHGVEEINVAFLSHANKQSDASIGDLNKVIDEVHVRVSRVRVGSKGFFFEICQPVSIYIQHAVTGISAVEGKVVPFRHPTLAIETRFKGGFHGLVKQHTVPVSIKWIEHGHFTARGENLCGVEGFPTVVQSVVVGVGTLWVGAQFLFSLICEAVVVWVAGGALVGVWPRIGFIFDISILGFVV